MIRTSLILLALIFFFFSLTLSLIATKTSPFFFLTVLIFILTFKKIMYVTYTNSRTDIFSPPLKVCSCLYNLWSWIEEFLWQWTDFPRRLWPRPGQRLNPPSGHRSQERPGHFLIESNFRKIHLIFSKLLDEDDVNCSTLLSASASAPSSSVASSSSFWASTNSSSSCLVSSSMALLSRLATSSVFCGKITFHKSNWLRQDPKERGTCTSMCVTLC